MCHLCFWFGDTYYTYYTFLQSPLHPDPTSTSAPWNTETQISQRYPKELGSITIRLLYVDAKIEQKLVIQDEALCKHTIVVLRSLGDGLKKSASARIGQPSRKQSTFLKTRNDHLDCSCIHRLCLKRFTEFVSAHLLWVLKIEISSLKGKVLYQKYSFKSS